MITLVQRIFAVACTEWRVTWRGLGLRLVLLLVALPFAALELVPGHQIAAWQDDGGLSTLTFTASFAALLATFVVVPFYRRDQALRTAEIVWVRPLGGASYLAGKALGAILVMGTILIEITGLVALYQFTGEGIVGGPLIVGVILGVAPALLLVAVLCVACGALLPHPLWGYLVMLVYCGLFGFFMTQSMVLLWNPWAQSLSYNRTLGFTLDLPLLLASRLFYAGLLLVAVGGASLLFALRERRALRSRRQGPIALALLLLGALVAGAAVPRFDAAARAVTPSGPVAAPHAVAVAVRDYRLDLRLDPATGAIDGTAAFLIGNDGTTPVAALPLYLNDGLRVGAARVDGRAVSIGGTTLFPTLMLAHPLAPGRRAAVHLIYAGRYKLIRAVYANDRPGLLGVASDVTPELHPSLVGAGLAVLYRDGDWYPRPWTQASTAWSPAPFGWHSVRIQIPAGVTTLASTSDLHRQGDTEVATWTLAGRLPNALLAALPPRYTRLAVPGGAIYAPGWDAHELRARYGPYITALRDLTAFFAAPTGPVNVVAVPTGRGEGAIGVGAAVGSGLALVPIDSLDRTPTGAIITMSHLPAAASYRAALSDLAIAWWADHLPARSGPTIAGASVGLPGGYVGVADERMVMGYDRSQMLAGYTGAAVAAARLGSVFYAREMALRRAASTLVLRDTHNQAQALLQWGEGPLAAPMRALGLSGRLDAYDASPALDDLRREIGPERLRHLLIDLAWTGRTPWDPTRVTCALSRASGHPVAPLARRYLGPYGLETGGCQ